MVHISNDQESADELRNKLLCMNYELESATMRAIQEVSKNEEITKELLHLLKVAYQERDEAKYQLQKLLSMFLPIPTENETNPVMPEAKNVSTFPQNASEFSTVQGSDVAYKTASCHTKYNFAADSSNFGFHNKAGVQAYDESIHPTMPLSNSKIVDPADVLIDNIVKVRPLPKKGRLFQAVMEHEPLLQTLPVAPLPKWKNPPPVPPLKLSSNPIYGCNLGSSEQIEAVNPIRAMQGSSSLGYSQIPSSSVLNFAHSSACMKNGVGNSSSDFIQRQIGTCKRRKRMF